jgi:hypothetical protein
MSKDINDVAHEVTGIVIAPAKPGKDRPILTWCHGTTGLGDVACPSAQPDPARELTVYFSPGATQQIDYGVPGVQGFIDAGYVVCATDYQGLGNSEVHQYMVSPTNARDAVFIAHAAREFETGAGTQLLAYGWSQGGGTAASVAELGDGDFGGALQCLVAVIAPEHEGGKPLHFAAVLGTPNRRAPAGFGIGIRKLGAKHVGRVHPREIGVRHRLGVTVLVQFDFFETELVDRLRVCTVRQP